MSNRNKKLVDKFLEQRRLDRARAELEANRARRKAELKRLFSFGNVFHRLLYQQDYGRKQPRNHS